MKNKILTADRVRELFNYNSKTGEVTRLVTTGSRAVKGSVINTTAKNITVTIDKNQYMLSNVIWLYVTGEFPNASVSMLNRDNTDFRFKNLMIMQHPDELTQAHIKRLFNYNPETGLFSRLGASASSHVIGEVIENIEVSGYATIKIQGIKYLTHRLAFLYMTGEFPSDCVDHINHIRHDNRWCNLRVVSKLENSKNKKMHKENKYGCFGISKLRSGNYFARITIDGVETSIGTFKSLDDAIQARKKCELDQGFHKNHGT